MNNSRFKFFLIPEAQLVEESKRLAPRLESVFTVFDENMLDVPELLFLVIAIVCQERRPHEWWMRGKSEFDFLQKPNSFFAKQVRELGVPFEGNSLADFFTCFRIKNLPTAVPRILHLWNRNLARLVLTEKTVTPVEMMIYQSQGERVVTLSRRCFLKGELVDGRRDALEFLLHDMAHSNLFFSATHDEQVNFFKSLRSVLQDTLPARDDAFTQALEYIMSDMNSSLAHLQQSLKAAVMDCRRRELQLSQEERLSQFEEVSLQEAWGNLW